MLLRGKYIGRSRDNGRTKAGSFEKLRILSHIMSTRHRNLSAVNGSPKNTCLTSCMVGIRAETTDRPKLSRTKTWLC